MKILFLTQIVPYPPDAGPRVKTWHVLRQLAERGHEIILATFVRSEETQYLEVLKTVCSEVHPVEMHRSRLSDLGYGLRSYLSGRPFLIERDDLPAMRRKISELLSRHDFDIIHTDQLGMTQFAAIPGVKAARIFDAHNAVWMLVHRTRENAPFFLKPLLQIEEARMRRYEGSIVARFEGTLAVTDIDRDLLAELLPGGKGHPAFQRIGVVPIAVDCQQLHPIPASPKTANILTLGTLHYPPNADGIRWFMHEVMPLIRAEIPQASLTIAGKNPPTDFRQAAEREPHVFEVTGYVPDLAPYFARASAIVVPVRVGSGLRVRILEAFARGAPVVTTTVGLEGIQAMPGRDVLVADQPADFARAVIRLLKDEAIQQQIGANGRRLAEDEYDWRSVLTRLDEVYAAAIQFKSGSTPRT
jgi:polysaccharide biosynthesis protein PslH